MKLIRGCLLAVAIFGCLANAQSGKPHHPPPFPWPPNSQTPQKPTQHPDRPVISHTPQKPTQHPDRPVISHTPQKPTQHPDRPVISHTPQKPTQHPDRPVIPQVPTTHYPMPHPLLPHKPSNTQTHQKPSDSKKPGDIWPPDPLICDVETHARIQCGLPSISRSECENINCCYDGQTCYYGKYVTLQCTKDGQFIVVIHRDATVPALTSESIRLNGECDPVDSTPSYIIYQFTVTSCGTTQTDETNVVVYENEMHCPIEITSGDRGSITRDAAFKLGLQCRYSGFGVESLIVEILPHPPLPPVAGVGPIHVGLFLGSGHCTTKGCSEDDVAFDSYYADSEYPISKVLRDPVYVDVQILERSDPALVLTLGRCWVTAGTSPYSYPQWDLIIDGCPNPDDKYLTRMLRTSQLPFPGHYKRFVFYMFTFMTSQASDPTQQKVQSDSPPLVPSKDQMFIHCETSVCLPAPGINCEPMCYIKGRKKRQVVSSAIKRRKTGTVTVSSKAINITSG